MITTVHHDDGQQFFFCAGNLWICLPRREQHLLHIKVLCDCHLPQKSWIYILIRNWFWSSLFSGISLGSSCRLEICKCSTDVCQLRLDFETFALNLVRIWPALIMWSTKMVYGDDFFVVMVMIAMIMLKINFKTFALNLVRRWFVLVLWSTLVVLKWISAFRLLLSMIDDDVGDALLWSATLVLQIVDQLWDFCIEWEAAMMSAINAIYNSS